MEPEHTGQSASKPDVSPAPFKPPNSAQTEGVLAPRLEVVEHIAQKIRSIRIGALDLCRNMKIHWVLAAAALSLWGLFGFFVSEANLNIDPQAPEPAKVYPIYGYSKIEQCTSASKVKKKGIRCWEIEIVDDNIPLTDELMEALQWKEDDVIEWRVTEDGFLSFKRAEE